MTVPRRGAAYAAVVCLVATTAGSAAAAEAIDRLDGIAPAIARCWQAPHEGDEVTVSVAFRRDGTVLGKPRITFIKASGGPDGQAAVANALLDAMRLCTPLRFTSSMGGSIAGRVLLIRLIAPRRERRAERGGSPGE